MISCLKTVASRRSLMKAALLVGAVIIVVSLAAVLYICFAVSPVVVARRQFAHRVTQRGGMFIAFHGREPCARPPMERARYHLRGLSPNNIGDSGDLAGDWALWRMTGVTVRFPPGDSPGEDWVIAGLGVMPSVCDLEFCGAMIGDSDIRDLFSECPPLSRSSAVRTIEFRHCILSIAALQAFPASSASRTWVALSMCDIRDGTSGDDRTRKELYGLTLGSMHLDEERCLSLFRAVSCRHLQLVRSTGISSAAWDEILSMPSLEWAELSFVRAADTLDGLLGSAAASNSLKKLVVYLPWYDEEGKPLSSDYSEVVKGLTPHFPMVTAVSLSMPRISEQSLRDLSELNQLKYVSLHVNEVLGSLEVLRRPGLELHCVKGPLYGDDAL